MAYDGSQYSGNTKRLQAVGNENDEEIGLYASGGQATGESQDDNALVNRYRLEAISQVSASSKLHHQH